MNVYARTTQLSALPATRQVNQQAGKAANQEACTHCCQQMLENTVGLLSKHQLSQHNIGLEPSPSR